MNGIFSYLVLSIYKIDKTQKRKKIKGETDYSLAIKWLTAKGGGQEMKQLKGTYGCCIIDKKVNISDSN